MSETGAFARQPAGFHRAAIHSLSPAIAPLGFGRQPFGKRFIFRQAPPRLQQ